MADLYYAGNGDDKLYIQSGQVTSTLKTSLAVTTVDTQPSGISYDGTNTIWSGGQADKLYLTSGSFTSTLKDSENLQGVDTNVNSASWDGTNTPWVGGSGPQLMLQSGQFTSTIKTSQVISDGGISGISFLFPGDTPWCGLNSDKLYMQSGQFTSTVKHSLSILSLSTFIGDMTTDATNTFMSAAAPGKLWVLSGQFTTTVLDSESVNAIEGSPNGLDISNVGSRLSPAPVSGDVAFSLPVFTVFGGFNPEADITLPSPTVSSTVSGETNASITLPIFTVLALGAASAELTLPILTVNATGSQAGDTDGDTAITLASLTLDAEGGAVGDTLGNIDITLPVITLNGAASFDDDIAMTLPIFTALGRAYNGSAPECVVMNTKNFAVSEYDLYGFNSMTKFNGSRLVADQNGIYEQDTSDTDNAGVDDYKIKAHVKTGEVDTSSDAIQRPRNMFLNYETDGDVRVFSRGNKRNNRSYLIPFKPGYDGIVERRKKFERGIRDNYFDFKIENIDGSQMEIDKFTVTLEPIVSKRR